MKNHSLIAGFSSFAMLAIAATILLFQNTTSLSAELVSVPEYAQNFGERTLAREPCKFLKDVALGMSRESCNRISRLECNILYKVKPNYKGDAYVYNNCLNQCVRDANEKCLYAGSKFILGER